MIPLISAFCFRSGGVGKDDRFLPFMQPPTPWASKSWRWCIGLPLAIFSFHFNPITVLLSLAFYWVAVSCFPYGEKSWLNFLGRYGKWCLYGAMFGIASVINIGLWGILQSFISAISFFILMKLSNDGITLSGRKWYLDQAYVEIGIGFLGTICYLIPR